MVNNQELSNTSNQLKREIAQRYSLKIALSKAEEKLKKLKTEQRYIRAIDTGKVGIWEWDIQTNEIYLSPNLIAMLGYTEQESFAYFDDWLQLLHPEDIKSVKLAINDYLEGLISKYELEYRMLHKNGSYIWFLTCGKVNRDLRGKPCLMAGSNTDITVYKQAENQLHKSLTEKQILLQEINHRVKNNFQIISSLLRIKAKFIHDEQIVDIFEDIQNRIRVIAITHENMSQFQQLTKIEFSKYIHDLTSNILCCYEIGPRIKLHLNIEQVFLKVETAIHCGFIINELITNAIKHAFKDRNTGNIYITFCREQEQYSLNISDDGLGLPQKLKLPPNKSIGLQVVWSLVEQLEGTIAFSSNNLGTLFTINFVM